MRASLVQSTGALMAAVIVAVQLSTAAAQEVNAPAAAAGGARSKGLRPPQVVVSEKAHARAARITEEAQGHYDAGRFDQAAEAYRRAYAVVPAPELLFNLGQCQRQLGKPERSVRYFEAYLRLRPDAPHRPLVEQLIEEGKLIAPAPQNAQHDNPPAIGANEPSDAPAAQPTPVHDVKVMPLPPPTPLPTSQDASLLADSSYDERDSPEVYERWWFWTAIAVVAAGAAITTYAVVNAGEDQPQSGATLGMISWE